MRRLAIILVIVLSSCAPKIPVIDQLENTVDYSLFTEPALITETLDSMPIQSPNNRYFAYNEFRRAKLNLQVYDTVSKERILTLDPVWTNRSITDTEDFFQSTKLTRLVWSDESDYIAYDSVDESLIIADIISKTSSSINVGNFGIGWQAFEKAFSPKSTWLSLSAQDNQQISLVIVHSATGKWRTVDVSAIYDPFLHGNIKWITDSKFTINEVIFEITFVQGDIKIQEIGHHALDHMESVILTDDFIGALTQRQLPTTLHIMRPSSLQQGEMRSSAIPNVVPIGVSDDDWLVYAQKKGCWQLGAVSMTNGIKKTQSVCHNFTSTPSIDTSFTINGDVLLAHDNELTKPQDRIINTIRLSTADQKNIRIDFGSLQWSGPTKKAWISDFALSHHAHYFGGIVTSDFRRCRFDFGGEEICDINSNLFVGSLSDGLPQLLTKQAQQFWWDAQNLLYYRSGHELYYSIPTDIPPTPSQEKSAKRTKPKLPEIDNNKPLQYVLSDLTDFEVDNAYIEVNGKRAYTKNSEFQGHTRQIVVYDGKNYGSDYDTARRPIGIGNELAYYAIKKGRPIIVYKNQEFGLAYTSVDTPTDVNGKLAFNARRDDNTVVLYDGKEIIGDYFATVAPKDIGGKLAYVAKDVQFGEPFIVIDGVEYGREYTGVRAPTSIAGKMAHYAVKEGKSVIVYDGREYGTTYDLVYQPVNINEELGFYASRSGQQFLNFRNAEYFEKNATIVNALNLNGHLSFEVKAGRKTYILHRGERYEDKNIHGSLLIDKQLAFLTGSDNSQHMKVLGYGVITGHNVTISGKVLENRKDCFDGGFCALTLDQAGAKVHVIYHPGDQRDYFCGNYDAFDDFLAIRQGDEVVAYGAPYRSDAITTCGRDQYSIHVLAKGG